MSDFPIPKDSYVAFDGLTIKEKIRERLNTTGIFTDQNFEGSNLAGFNDAMAMTFSLLLFYCNQSVVDGKFSITNVYENMNKIVKDWDYKPVGHQSATLTFTMSADTIPAGFYTIPRYTALEVGGFFYSFNEDVPFTKATDGDEQINDIASNNILYQGIFVEMPIFNPAGNPNEIIYLTVDDNAIVDNFNIHVYVENDQGVWEQWNRTQSLFLNLYEDKVFEVRFNENRRYELKFGDGINGKQLSSSNRVAIYYLLSNGKNGEVGVNALANATAIPFNGSRLNTILSQQNENYLSNIQLRDLYFGNKFPSTYYSQPESVESIRKNAPSLFRSQFTLNTAKSYETFIKSNFGNIVHDVTVNNNAEYLDTYMKYFYELGVSKPQFESRALFNQINFSDSCNFNNVYITIVPKTVKNNLSYLAPAQKTMIVEAMEEEKVLTADIVPVDPVYIAFDINVSDTQTITTDSIGDSKLVVVKSLGSRRSETSIKQDIESAIRTFFSVDNNVLGQTINLNQLNTNILNIDGIDQLYTKNMSTGAMVEGAKFALWNPVYFENSKAEAGSVVRLEDFQFPYLNNYDFVSRIIVM